MKNKLLVCVCALALLGLSSCQKDKTDLLAIDAQIAQNTLLGIYVYTVVDSTAMNTTIYEWTIVKDGTGTYHKRTSGNGAIQEEQANFTWTATVAEDNLGMDINAVFADGTAKKMKWANGQLETGEYVTTSKAAGSIIATAVSLEESLQSAIFLLSDTVFFQAEDSIPFIAWKSDVEFVLPEDTAATKQQLLNDLAPYMDTLRWYIEKFGPVGKAYIDSTTNELRDLVVIDTVASKRGKNAGKHGVTYLLQYMDTTVEMRNVGPLTTKNGTITLKREGENNIAEFSYRFADRTSECYTDPSSDKATLADSTYTMATATWTISSITTSRVFNVLLRGNESQQIIEQKAGVETRNVNTTKENARIELPISGFIVNKGVLVYDGNTYNLKTE